jgi:hypothetical protein
MIVFFFSRQKTIIKKNYAYQYTTLIIVIYSNEFRLQLIDNFK